jgi:hypothetical protein
MTATVGGFATHVPREVAPYGASRYSREEEINVREVFFLISLLWVMTMTLAQASDPSNHEDQLSFCEFGPKITVIPSLAKPTSDPCAEKLHVQGVLWKCESAETVETDAAHFLDELNRLAHDECRKHCSRLGEGCHAIYSNSPECRLGADREKAVELGKHFGCRNDCSSGGKAFAYCALYNAGYLGKGTDAVQVQPLNCECRSGD